MRADQIYAALSIGRHRLTAACLCSPGERRIGGGMLAVPLLPGRAKRFHPYPHSRRYRRR